VIRAHGRVYVQGTAEGFRRMRERGIPQPSIRREDLFARSVAAEFESLFEGLVPVVAEAAIDFDVTVKKEFGETVIVHDAAPDAIIRRLMELMGGRLVDVGRLRLRLNSLLVGAQRKFMEDLLNDADPRTLKALASMSIPATEVFRARIGELRDLYLDNAEDRIVVEGDNLKREFLQKLVDWAKGETTVLNVSALMAEMRDTSARRARFFARDQFSRFNRSLLIGTYRQAEAPYVEWLTCGDDRVRPTHVARNHKIYTIPGLLADVEWHSYNCRCGWAPLYELTAEQRKRQVA
jgi:hypothetical protein